MIEDTSACFSKAGSWTDLSNAATAGFTHGPLVPAARTVSDHALIVHQNASESIGESEVAQLLARARVVLPAVMNYLYFNSTKVAVVYFGKTMQGGKKMGIRSGAEDFKIRMIRFLTSEIWPPLLRTDAPDESLGANYLHNPGESTEGKAAPADATSSRRTAGDDAFGSNGGPSAPGPAHESPFTKSGVGSPPTTGVRQYSRETVQEISWFKKSIENHMQVLLYLKKGMEGTKYLKVILNNSAHRIHFDVVDTKEEKYRWELRMLYTRLMDNLETQKAIDSYESYEANFRLACATAAANLVELERPLQAMTPVTMWGTAHHEKPTRLGESTWSTDDDGDEDANNMNEGDLSDADGAPDGCQGDDCKGNRDRGQLRMLRRGCPRSDTFSYAESPRGSSPTASHPGSSTAFALTTLPQPMAAGAASPVASFLPPTSVIASSTAARCGDEKGVDGSRSMAHTSAVGASHHTDVDSAASPTSQTTAAHQSVLSVRSLKCQANETALEEDEKETPQLCQAPVSNNPFTAHSRGTRLNPSTTRYYRWMENLQRPESTTLDYKSYFSHTAMEIRHRCVKFMCGFLNAYREGKLVIGVHEIPRRDADGKLETSKAGKNSIVLHNDLIDQFVVGVRMSEDELEEVQEDVSQQLLCCVPPIPPQTVSIDVVPVVFPEEFAYSQRVLILYEENSYGPSRDSLKQKSNYAIRFLNPLGLSILPLDFVDGQLSSLVLAHRGSLAESGGSDGEDGEDASESGKQSAARASSRAGRRQQRGGGERRSPLSPSAEFHPECLKAEAYMIAATDNAAALTECEWEGLLSEAIGNAKSRCQHFFTDWPTTEMGCPLVVPQLHVVEVSVDIKRCQSHALTAYRGKFFTGWPSIPIWDAATRNIRRVERNYNIFAGGPSAPDAAALAVSARSLGAAGRAGVDVAAGSPHSGGARELQMSSPTTYLNASASGGGFQRAMVRYGWAWFANLQIVNSVMTCLYGPGHTHDVLQFRRVHPVWNRVFENRQGVPLVHMINSTPVGVPMFNNSPEHISRTQYAFLHEGVPPMPLILCRIYEIIGNLPSPYPFVTVPLVQQSFRVSSFLIPIFYRQHYFDGTMRISVVLDLRDGILKTMQLRDGNLVLEAIVGMCFEKMNKRQVTRQLERVAAKQEEQRLYQEARSHAKFASRSSTPHRPTARSGRYASNFLARRTLQPQMLRSSRGRLSSTILSPMQSESTRLTRREVEPNIPLIHFRFLTRKLLDEGSFIVSESPTRAAPPPPRNTLFAAATPPPPPSTVRSSSPSQWQETREGSGLPPRPFQGSSSSTNRTSWTLQHLLSWYNALLTDSAHLRVFGYCQRSIAFNVADFSEICEDDVEPGALDLASVKDLEFAPCREACTLHRKVMEWMEV